VAIDALEFDRLAVDEKHPVLDFHFAKAGLRGNKFHPANTLVRQFHHQCVKVWRLSRPQERIAHGQFNEEILVAGGGGFSNNQPACRIKQARIDLTGVDAFPHDFPGNFQTPVAIGRIKLRKRKEIAEVRPGHGLERNGTEDAR